MRMLANNNPPIEAGESSVAGLVALIEIMKTQDIAKKLELDSDSIVLLFGTEGATDPEIYNSNVAVKKEDYQFKESWKEEGSVRDLLHDFSIYDSNIFPELEESMPLYKWGIYIRSPLKSMITKTPSINFFKKEEFGLHVFDLFLIFKNC